MAQAKTLTQTELDQVLRFANAKQYPERNRALILTSFYLGLRVAEIASLKRGDIVNEDGSIKNEIRLSSTQTKGGHPRTVFIPEKLKPEYICYLKTRHISDPSIPFFHTDNRLGFSANGLCVWFFQLYRNSGISGASSHSGRRTMITTLANKGVGVRVLAEIAGHRSIAVTQKYIDANPEMMRNAMNLI
ncbi:integrase [Polynucleobacter sp. QLW-P1DATA-2]|uniref:tyrosine-type recombinase/integrase n=1 Tax=unclassified Polynucleobacter TaxID=2640945 RepID=UPI0008F84F3C|nr:MULTISPECIES: site-specific integrase [unclassified Polynucleobacter]OIM97776.1 integrase [Polynucleobacter sp. MWH-Tro8-2-5-gr]OIN03344.1 integrase [Polynucleobacter sp. QLW-P1DATA-2]